MKKLIAPGIVLILLAILAYGLTRNPRDIPSPLVMKEAPDFSLQLFDGGRFQLSNERGKVVVINFWASWCLACKDEAPVLEGAWERYRDKGVLVVGVNVQDRREDALAFIKEHGKTYPNGPDDGGKIAISYGMYGVPETFVIDKNGRIIYKHVGAVTWEILSAKIEAALQAAE